jgi:hypothetical protein
MSGVWGQGTGARRREQRGKAEDEGVGSGPVVVPHHPRGPDDGRVGTPARVEDQSGSLPHHPRGPRERARDEVPPAGRPGLGVHQHRRGEPSRRRRQVPRSGLRASKSHYDLADGGTPHPAPAAAAFGPYARALVALALEVRAEGLALPGERRSHGPLGKGGSRCVA